MENQTSPLTTQEVVRRAVAAARTQNQEEIEKAFILFDQVDLDDLTAELCVQLQATTADVDIDRIMNAVLLPIPDSPVEILTAIWRVDTGKLRALTGNDVPTLLASLVLLLAALQEAKERAPVTKRARFWGLFSRK